MRQLFTVFTLFILITCKGQGQNKLKYDLSFQKGNDVYAMRLTDKKQLCFRNASDPAISPDGYRLAFTRSKDSAKGFVRYIVIADLDTRKEKRMNVKNSNYFGASWSPDGSYIAYNIFLNYIWQIGIIRSDNSGLMIIPADSGTGLFEPEWTPDSKSLVAHTMETLFRFDLSGNVLDTINLSSILGEKYDISSDSRFFLMPDGNSVVFTCGTDESMKNVEGPVEAVFIYDKKSKVIERLSPKGMFASDLNYENDHSVVFSGSKENEKQNNIYRVDLVSKKIEMILKNGMSPTIRLK